MEKKKPEVQSRRDFFKKAVKASLPILGIAVLVSNPVVAKATQIMDCNSSCSSSCKGSCTGGCSGRCSGGCSGSCSGSCAVTCLSSSANNR